MSKNAVFPSAITGHLLQWGFLLEKQTKETSFCLGATSAGSAQPAHLRRVSPHRIAYRQSLNIWTGTTWTWKSYPRVMVRLWRRRCIMRLEQQNRRVGFEISSWFGLRRKLAALRAAQRREASFFHVVRQEPGGVSADVGKSVYLQSPCMQSSHRLQRTE